MATEKQRAAAKRHVRKAQAAAKKQTLKNLPAGTRAALGKEAAAVRRGDEPTPQSDRLIRQAIKGKLAEVFTR
jgi:hypothetical protein